MSRKSQNPVYIDQIPYSDEVEQAMLGCIIIDPEVRNREGRNLNPDHFYVRANQLVFQCIDQLLASGLSPDLITIRSKLEDERKLEEAGGIQRLISLSESMTSAYAESYMQVLQDYLELREANNHGRSLQRASSERDLDAVRELLSHPPVTGSNNGHPRSPREANLSLLEQLRKEATGEFRQARSTGIPALDNVLTGGGFRPGQLITIAARPSMGKSVMGHNLATTTARNHGPVLFVSLEMSAEELQERAIAAVLGDSPRNMIARFGEKALQQIEEAMLLTELPITYDDSSSQSLEHISSHAHSLTQQEGELGIIVIDYLQLIGFSRLFQAEPVQAISQITRGLKSLARKLGVPVVMLSQLSRAVEKRIDKRPMLSDLRDSGSVEQDSDIVIFLYRDHYYNKEADPHETEIIIGKQRSGPTGTVMVNFNQGTSTFSGRGY